MNNKSATFFFLFSSFFGLLVYAQDGELSHDPRDLLSKEKLSLIKDCPVPPKAILSKESRTLMPTLHYYSVDGTAQGPAFISEEGSPQKITVLGCYKNGRPSGVWQQIDQTTEEKVIEISISDENITLTYIKSASLQKLLPLEISGKVNPKIYDRIRKSEKSLGYLGGGSPLVFCNEPEICGEIVKVEDHKAWTEWGRLVKYLDQLDVPVSLGTNERGDFVRLVSAVQGDWCLTSEGWVHGKNCLIPPERRFSGSRWEYGVSDRTVYTAPDGEELPISKKWKSQVSVNLEESPFIIVSFGEKKTVNNVEWIKVKLKGRKYSDYADGEIKTLLIEAGKAVEERDLWIKFYNGKGFNPYELPEGC